MREPANKRVTPELLALVVEMLPDAASLRDICAVTGLGLGTVRHEAAPFLAIMKLAGTHPQCACGRDRFHPYGCTDTYAKRADVTTEMIERRAKAIEMLVAGERLADISAILGLTQKARYYLRYLTSDERAARAAAIRSRSKITPHASLTATQIAQAAAAAAVFARSLPLLVEGWTIERVAEEVGRSPQRVGSFLTRLTPEQRHERALNMAAARGRRVQAPAPLRQMEAV